VKTNTSLKTAIIKTLAYSNLFNFPLIKNELWQRLIIKASHPPQKPDFNSALEGLLKNGLVEKDKAWFFLKGRRKICRLRQRSKKISQEKKSRLKKTTGWLKRIPTIKMVALTGALAMDNAVEDDDLDLLIITSANRLWSTRILLIGLTEFLGMRRRPKQKETKDKICLNMFLDTTALEIARNKRNLYTAYQVIQIKPIINIDFAYERFLLENHHWIKRYLPNNPIVSLEIAQLEPIRTESPKTGFFNQLEKWLYRLQAWYMKPGLTRETITAHSAFFHPQERAKKILTRFQELVLNKLAFRG